jgi:small redox-active disulfide protein 2
MDIKILGSGCAKCQALDRAAHDAVDQLGLDVDFEKVTDPAAIAAWGVMTTPALVVDDEVVLSGRVPTADDVVAVLTARTR